ncbi:hypothetical protein [Halorussus lipolyticus]|uniref:hypothetical protein n=1 Tax=Halorussus lipolyticus TaxID=3034024 RepID=UPI0023E8A808|nr:hypothetical protein [Halorussus sp. DT80]
MAAKLAGMSEPNVLESLPDRSMKQSEVEKIDDSDAVEWTEPLRTGTPRNSELVHAWILETGGTGYVLLYELDGWVSQGSFDTEDLSEDEKRERGEEILDF